MRIKDENERKFYEIEATQSGWSIRTLQQQYNSSLYERLALSREKGEVLRLALEGNIVTRPQDIVKQPTVLEFLGLDEKVRFVESDLEQRSSTSSKNFYWNLERDTCLRPGRNASLTGKKISMWTLFFITVCSAAMC
jgi:predicted nuclease of restriction endonuclease-like (RecB) superfamily